MCLRPYDPRAGLLRVPSHRRVNHSTGFERRISFNRLSRANVLARRTLDLLYYSFCYPFFKPSVRMSLPTSLYLFVLCCSYKGSLPAVIMKGVENESIPFLLSSSSLSPFPILVQIPPSISLPFLLRPP